MSVDVEKLMESKGLPESDRDEVRDFLELLAARSEFRRAKTDEGRQRFRAAIERASKQTHLFGDTAWVRD